MMVDILPDPEVVAVAWARADADIAAIAGTRISTNFPANPTFPLATVISIPGGETIGVEAALFRVAHLQWDCYGYDAAHDHPDYENASLLARTIAQKANEYMGLIADAGVIMGFEILAGPHRIDDPETGYARFVLDTAMSIRREPPS